MKTDAFMSLLRQYFAHKTIMITGASGFIGSKLMDALAAFSCQIIGVSRNLSNRPITTSKIAWVAWPTNESEWKNILTEADIIFHLAAQTSMEQANRDPTNDFKSNVLPVLSMISSIQYFQKRIDLVFTSTASIYGCPSQLPVDESFPDHPQTTYCLHKKLAEDYLHAAVLQKKLSVISMRLSNVYGPGASSSSPDRSILNKMISFAAEGKTLEVFDQGSEIRDYIFIDDAITALLLAASYCKEAQGQTYVLGSGFGTSILSAVQMITRVAKDLGFPSSTIKHTTPTTRLGINQRNFVANSQKFITLTGWEVQTDLQKGIEKTFQAIQDKVIV